MKNFEFSFPTYVVFGRGAERQLGKLVKPYGTRVMLLYGSERIRRSGLYQAIETQLKEQGLSVLPFGGIEENPTLAKAEEGCFLAREHKITLLLAVGGGSVIDTAKAISLGACCDTSLWNIYEQRTKAIEALPIGVVLTAAATASEANGTSVLRNEAENRKCALIEPLTYPKFSVLNPELTFTLPAYQTAACSVDIFSHAFERYFHKEQYGTLRIELCSGVMRTVINELPCAIATPNSYEARSQLMWTATMAHSDMLGKEGDFACHAMSHILTQELGLAHGVALGILMIAWCKYMLVEEVDSVAEFATGVWQVSNTGDKLQTAENGISAFQHFINSVGLPVTLREAGFPEVSTEQLTDKTILRLGEYIGGNFRRLHRDDVSSIFQLAKG